MKQKISWNKKCCTALSTALFSGVLMTSGLINNGNVFAGELTPEVNSQIQAYKEKLSKWSSDKDIIKAVEEMNARAVSMSNQTWKTLAKDTPEVMKFQKSTAGKKLTDWQKDKLLGKLFLRDGKGNLVASSKKPAIFNISERKAFTKAITGNAWSSAKAKPDPTTNLASIQISAPVISKGKSIGVIHTSLIIE